MSQLSSYELQQVLSKRFSLGMESEQEIEINAEEVIINSDATVDGEIEDINTSVTEVDETTDRLDDVDDAVATLESLIYSMESSILVGGFDRRTAGVANIALESITSRFDLDPNYLSFGLEAVDDDAESETTSAITKAKTMIGALKSNTGALINKMYMAAAAALGNNTALSAKLIAKATAIKSNINQDNKGGNVIKMSGSVSSKLNLDGTPLAPDAYVKELKRTLDKYNSVVKSYSDNDVLSKFVKDQLSSSSSSASESTSKKAVLQSVKALSEGITKSSKSTGDSEVHTSDRYLGGMLIARTRPTIASIKNAATNASSKPNEQVSQEAVGTAMIGTVKALAGAILFIFSGKVLIGTLLGAIPGTISSGVIGAAAAGAGGALFGVLLSAGLFCLIGFIATHGVVLGCKMIRNGATVTAKEIIELTNAGKSKVDAAAIEVQEVSTIYSIETSGTTSMESNDGVISLNAKQVDAVANLVTNTSATTRNMQSLLKTRKSLISEVNNLTKELATQDSESNVAMVKSNSMFIKQFIKQTIRFEMEMTTYAVSTMKAALAYAEASNGSAPAAEANDDDEKKTVA